MDTISTITALADETRMRVVCLLQEAEDLCSCEIQSILKLNQSNLSRHLTRLRQSGLIKGEKRGQWAHLQINSGDWEEQKYIPGIIKSAKKDLPLITEDLRRLKSYRSSGYSCKTIGEWQH